MIKIHVNDDWKATEIELAGGEHVSADWIISNADYHWTETRLLESKRQTFPESYREKRLMAPSGFILYLGVKGEVKNLQHHTLLFCEDWNENFQQIFHKKQPPEDPSLYICCPSKTDPTTAPEGHENLFVLVPFPPDVYLSDAEKEAYTDKLLTLIEEQIWEKFRERIVEKSLFTAEDFSSRYHAYKWSALGLAHSLMQTSVLRPNTISKKVKNLAYTGGYTNPGIGMPMCLISGKLAAERVKETK